MTFNLQPFNFQPNQQFQQPAKPVFNFSTPVNTLSKPNIKHPIQTQSLFEKNNDRIVEEMFKGLEVCNMEVDNLNIATPMYKFHYLRNLKHRMYSIPSNQEFNAWNTIYVDENVRIPLYSNISNVNNWKFHIHQNVLIFGEGENYNNKPHLKPTLASIDMDLFNNVVASLDHKFNV
jgi:hypothetical protein